MLWGNGRSKLINKMQKEPSVKGDITRKAHCCCFIHSVEKRTEHMNLLKQGLKDKMVWIK